MRRGMVYSHKALGSTAILRCILCLFCTCQQVMHPSRFDISEPFLFKEKSKQWRLCVNSNVVQISSRISPRLPLKGFVVLFNQCCKRRASIIGSIRDDYKHPTLNSVLAWKSSWCVHKEPYTKTLLIFPMYVYSVISRGAVCVCLCCLTAD